MRTLRPAAHDISFTVELVSVGNLGHVMFTGHNQESHSLHVFTLNGRHLSSVNVSHRVTGECRSQISKSTSYIKKQSGMDGIYSFLKLLFTSFISLMYLYY